MNDKIQEMQFLEQTLQSIIYQKQTFQMDLSETISALEEIKKSEEDVYKVLGQIMIKVSKEKIEKELEEKKKIINSRLKTIDEQEKTFMEKANKLRGEILRNLEKKE